MHNSSHDSGSSESDDQFNERMKTPWIRIEPPETAPEHVKKKVYRSNFAFFGLIRCKEKGYLAIILRKIDNEGGTLDLEISFEHRHRHHPVKLAEIVRCYF